LNTTNHYYKDVTFIQKKQTKKIKRWKQKRQFIMPTISLKPIRKYLSANISNTVVSKKKTESPFHGRPFFILNGCGDSYFLFL